MSGPLESSRIIEIAGIGPGPMAGLMLADMGAEVIRLDRVHATAQAVDPANIMRRGRRSLNIDLSLPDAKEIVLSLAERSDALFEPFRPGVAERLGIGPDDCLARNPRLVYARVSGWGQSGPLAQRAGHDINYIALAGALEPIGPEQGPPLPPLNLVGDMAGGGMLLAFGIVCGLFEAQRSGQGQVIDAAMTDGAALLMSMFYAMRAIGKWNERRGTNMLDTAAHFYQVYETADQKYVAVGAIEPQFYAQLLNGLGLGSEILPDQYDEQSWPTMKRRFASIFRSRTRDEWCGLFEGSDACLSPVLSMTEAPEHPHNRHRGTFSTAAGLVQPAPAPRFSRTPGAHPAPPPAAGQHTDEILRNLLGLPDETIRSLRASRTIS